jgi:ATP-dependent DNA ligase
MLKIKRFETVDCVVYGYQVGRGKYEGTIGALLIGYYDVDSKKIIHCSKVNCGTDEDRDWWRDYFKANANYFDTDSPFGIIPQEKFKVIEVKCQEITEKSLRHPVYIRRRDDKSIEMCTKETIFKE